MSDADAIRQLRATLADPANAISPTDSIGRHREALANVWNRAVSLANGDPRKALEYSKEALRSGKQPYETDAEYKNVLNGIPSRAFGDAPPYGGVDKPQHFFASAQNAMGWPAGYTAPGSFGGPDSAQGNAAVAQMSSQGAGRLYEAYDWVRGLFSGKNTGGYDRGDIFADDCGAKFGAHVSEVTNGGEKTLGQLNAPDLLSHFGKNGVPPPAVESDPNSVISEQGQRPVNVPNFSSADANRSNPDGSVSRADDSARTATFTASLNSENQAVLEQQDQQREQEYSRQAEEREEQQREIEQRDQALQAQYQAEQQDRTTQEQEQNARDQGVEEQREAEQRDAQQRDAQQRDAAEQEQREQTEQAQREQEEREEQDRQLQSEQRQQDEQAQQQEEERSSQEREAQDERAQQAEREQQEEREQQQQEQMRQEQQEQQRMSQPGRPFP